MTKKILTFLFSVVLLSLLMVQTGCVKEDFDKTPALVDSSSWVKTVTIAQLKALIPTPQDHSTQISGLVSKLATQSFWDAITAQGVSDSSIVLEGYVITSDSTGNFYETVTIIDGTGGIDLKINASEIYLNYGFKPGKKVLVRVNDLALSYYHGVYQVGLPYTDAGGVGVTGINPEDVDTYIQRSGKRIAWNPTDTVKINTLSTSNVQTLIRLDSVQFRSKNTTFSDPGINTNRILVDSKGNVILLRTSGYASFSQDSLPSGSGSVVGILGVYNDTYQLSIRDLSDIKFDNPTFDDNIPTPNTTISALKAMCTSNLVQITQNVVIQGVVNANDESGNIYKQLFIEDETGAITFGVDVVDLYKSFPVGTKIVVNCKDLYLGKYGNVVQLGGVYGGAIGRLSATDFSKNVFIVESGLDVFPVETTISGINDNLIGKVITLSDVQFISSNLGLTFAGTSTTNRNLEDINGASIIVRTSAYANFASKILPEGSGSITAVLSKYYNDYQLYIRDYDEVQMQQPRFEIVAPTANTTIAELKAMFTVSPMQITGNVIIEGVVVGNDISGNLYKQLFISDETSAIEFKVNVTSLYQNYPVGTKVVINCNGMYLGTYGGVIQLGGLYNGSFGMIESTEFNNKVFISGTSAVTSTETTISGINDAMIGKLIKLKEVQFIDSDLTKVYAESSVSYTNRTLEDASNNTIIVRTSKYANFASTTLPSNSGTFVAILSKYNSTYQLYIREIGDVVFDQTRIP